MHFETVFKKKTKLFSFTVFFNVLIIFSCLEYNNNMQCTAWNQCHYNIFLQFFFITKFLLGGRKITHDHNTNWNVYTRLFFRSLQRMPSFRNEIRVTTTKSKLIPIFTINKNVSYKVNRLRHTSINNTHTHDLLYTNGSSRNIIYNI